MIVGQQKPVEDLIAKLQGYHRILVLGCGGCVTVCQTGGAREAEKMAHLLRMALGPDIEIEWDSVARQCEYEFLDPVRERQDSFDAVLSLACGVGVQALAEVLPVVPVIPGLNTVFAGMPVADGVWEERCQACGDCILDLTGGICPVARCSKSLLNGPCGGSQNGKCEISDTVDCAWQLIYDRLERQGRLEVLEKLVLPKNWSRSRDGGPRRMMREGVEPHGEE